GDRRQVLHRTLHLLGVLRRFADTHVDDDLLQPRHLHHVLVAELRDESRLDRRFVLFFQTRRHSGTRQTSMTSPERLATRTLRPSSRFLKPIRVGLFDFGSTWETLETWIPASFSTTPPWSRAVWR